MGRCRVRLELRLACLVALAIQPLGSAVRAQIAQEPFTVGDIRIEGLQRISGGTEFNYLPVNIGDHLAGQHRGEAMRAPSPSGVLPLAELPLHRGTPLGTRLIRPS